MHSVVKLLCCEAIVEKLTHLNHSKKFIFNNFPLFFASCIQLYGSFEKEY
jgi:hypothetical protein